MSVDVRYCTTEDGVQIAYSVAGEGPPLIRVLGWFTHLEYEPQTGMWGGYREAIGKRYTMVVYDGRGTGLSDRDVERISRAGFTKDLEAVIDATGFERVALFGISQGGSVAIRYALDNPERVSHLALYGTFARSPMKPEEVEMMMSLMRQGWGSDLPAHRQFFTSLFMPDSPSPDDVKTANELQRISAEPDAAAAIFAVSAPDPDLFERLKDVTIPTLVMHRRGDAISPFEEGRAIASKIPGARFLALEGSNHALTTSEAGVWETMADAVDQLIQPDASPRKASEPSSFRTILFTDIVGHTEMMSRLGDEAGRDVLREHEHITRDVLKANGGTEVKTMGDGFMASFGSVTKAVECAIAFQKAFEERNSSAQEPLSVRVGLNAGEPIEEDGDLFGATVILASRIAAKADGGEILASDVIRGLCSGKGFLFADRGDFVAKGFEEPVHLFEINWHG
ncbi:MAG: adenylate/guanylate cyclase domain-containing protein [Chloroflexi bacterium]|nr:adenylate/guanylate cyclase domain-containing protein [Chloroflexota bacterium]